jgi:glutathione S-transferase
MDAPRLTLVSHLLCPYVQRAVIVLKEKQAAFERRDVDLSNKPDWFLKVSPLGKTPVLLVEGEAIFESAVICEYLDETIAPALHPRAPLARAKHRSYMELGSTVLNAIAAFYTAPDEAALQARAVDIRARLAQLEPQLGNGPYFAGTTFSMVDAVFGPIFRYFDIIDRIDDFGIFSNLPRVRAWRAQLAHRPSVREAVREDYPQLLQDFFVTRRSALSQRITAPTLS